MLHLNAPFFPLKFSVPPIKSLKCSVNAHTCGRHGGLMVSALDSGASAPGSSPGRGHCVVFLGKTLYSHGG